MAEHEHEDDGMPADSPRVVRFCLGPGVCGWCGAKVAVRNPDGHCRMCAGLTGDEPDCDAIDFYRR